MPFDRGVLGALALSSALGGAIVLLLASLRAGTTAFAPERWTFALRRRATPTAGLRLLAGAGTGVLVLIATRWPVAAAAAAALILTWPVLFGGARTEHLAMARLEALVTWTESLRDSVSANVSLEQAIAVSTQRAPLLLQPALTRLGGQLRVQTPVDSALRDLAADLDTPGADLVIAALILSVRRRGDRLSQVLSGLSIAAREELDLRRRISAGRAGLRRSVQIIVVITIALAAYLTAFGGAFLHPYDSAAGQVALAGVVGLFATGFAWMRHLSAEPETAAFLARPHRPPDPAETQVITLLTAWPTTPTVPAAGFFGPAGSFGPADPDRAQP
jgi:Flp pilus assembly protein TadB